MNMNKFYVKFYTRLLLSVCGDESFLSMLLFMEEQRFAFFMISIAFLKILISLCLQNARGKEKIDQLDVPMAIPDVIHFIRDQEVVKESWSKEFFHHRIENIATV